jgi:leucyl-tRNA synthetase
MMIFLNETMKLEIRPRKLMENFVLLLAPFAPHISEELWEKLGNKKSLAYEQWPAYAESKCAESIVEVVLQVNGKIRSKIAVALNTSNSELERLAMEDVNIKRHTEGKRIIKKIVVPNKLVNIVIAG